MLGRPVLLFAYCPYPAKLLVLEFQLECVRGVGACIVVGGARLPTADCNAVVVRWKTASRLSSPASRSTPEERVYEELSLGGD